MSIAELLSHVQIDLAPYEELYKYLHSHPELSNQEVETAKTAITYLSGFNAFKIHSEIGGNGFAGVLENGPGKIILLRADMDALPVKEATGLPYASTVTQVNPEGKEFPVMHACGHDMHVTCLLAAAEILVKMKASWSGTLIVLFQPAEERGTGAQDMVDDGLYKKIPVPDFVLGQHVMPLKTGYLGSRPGTIMASADSFKITLYGRGGHGSMPHRTIDPVVMAANLVTRLQTIVSRSIDPSEMAVVTVGSLQVGNTENVIVDHAELGVDVRTMNLQVRDQVLAGIKRMVQAEYIASGSKKEPTIVQTRHFPTTDNDEDLAERIAVEFKNFFGDKFIPDMPAVSGSEDVSILATSQGKPSYFWFFGGVEPELWDEKEKAGTIQDEIPVNHSPQYAPVIQPTLRTGVDALCVATLTFLRKKT